MGKLERLRALRTIQRTGSFPGYAMNSVSMLEVVSKHLAASEDTRSGRNDGRISLAGGRGKVSVAWRSSIGKVNGLRNAQVTVLAPTGTIGFMMDCATTGIEPMMGLVIVLRSSLVEGT